MMIDGPASPMPSPMITKMPVPMTAPMPSAVRSRTPTERFRPCSGSPLASRTRTSVGLRANGPGRVAVAMVPALPAARVCQTGVGRWPSDRVSPPLAGGCCRRLRRVGRRWGIGQPRPDLRTDAREVVDSRPCARLHVLDDRDAVLVDGHDERVPALSHRPDPMGGRSRIAHTGSPTRMRRCRLTVASDGSSPSSCTSCLRHSRNWRSAWARRPARA